MSANNANTVNSPTLSLGAMLHITPQDNQNSVQTYAAFTHLVQRIEELGFDQAWVTEHHFAQHSLTPAPLTMMGHFLAHTTTLKLGAAAVLIGFHNPIEVAEQLATLNALYPNRVLCGFAKGGPFESQNAAYKITPEVGRQRMEEAVPALLGLMTQMPHTHTGAHYQWHDIALYPTAPLNAPWGAERFFLATSNEQTIQIAANHNIGLMAAQFWDDSKIANNVALYKQRHPQGHAPQMMGARGVFIDDCSKTAQKMALEHIQNFRTQKAQLWGKHKHDGPLGAMQPREMLSKMLVGTPEEVKLKTQQMLSKGVTHLGLNPLTSLHDSRLDQLEWFKTEIWTPLTQNAFNPLLMA